MNGPPSGWKLRERPVCPRSCPPSPVFPPTPGLSGPPDQRSCRAENSPRSLGRCRGTRGPSTAQVDSLREPARSAQDDNAARWISLPGQRTQDVRGTWASGPVGLFQNPLMRAVVESHPCAQNAQGWGTRHAREPGSPADLATPRKRVLIREKPTRTVGHLPFAGEPVSGYSGLSVQSHGSCASDRNIRRCGRYPAMCALDLPVSRP